MKTNETPELTGTEALGLTRYADIWVRTSLSSRRQRAVVQHTREVGTWALITYTNVFNDRGEEVLHRDDHVAQVRLDGHGPDHLWLR